MGRYVTPRITSSNLTADYNDSGSSYDVNGYLTAYTANDISYTNIAYETDTGSSADFGGTFKRITGWTETNNVNNSTQTVTVNYNGTTSRVSSLSIT